jgi:hypothetical protein
MRVSKKSAHWNFGTGISSKALISVWRFELRNACSDLSLRFKSNEIEGKSAMDRLQVYRNHFYLELRLLLSGWTAAKSPSSESRSIEFS